MNQLSKKELSRLFLLSWWDSVQLMADLVPLIAETINTTPENIFYERHLNFDFIFPEKIKGTQWRCMFHGIGDCAVTHEVDGRHLEIPFGLNSRYDHVDAWGTMLYIMSSKSPWPDYPNLKSFLAEKPPPYNYLSGSHEKMQSLSDQFYRLPIFEKSDPKMASIKEKQQGAQRKEVPDDIDFKEIIEFSVCDWLVLNELGQELINLGLPKKDFYQLWKEAELD